MLLKLGAIPFIRSSYLKKLSTTQLKQLARDLVQTQGNKFVKELLRDNDVPIGVNKQDFIKNLNIGIDGGQINQQKIEDWLARIDGWGNQHIYLLEAPKCNFSALKTSIMQSTFKTLADQETSLEYPFKFELKTISLSHNEVTFGWHQGSEKWIRDADLDEIRKIKSDTYEFRAHRHQANRQIARLNYRFGDKHCSLFMTHAKERDAHEQLFKVIWKDLAAVDFCQSPLLRMSLKQQLTALGKRSDLKIKSIRMHSHGSYVDVVSTAPNQGVHDDQFSRRALKGADPKAALSSDNVFRFNSSNLAGLSKPIRVDASGTDSRLYIRAQCPRSDVLLLVSEVLAAT